MMKERVTNCNMQRSAAKEKLLINDRWNNFLKRVSCVMTMEEGYPAQPDNDVSDQGNAHPESHRHNADNQILLLSEQR